MANPYATAVRKQYKDKLKKYQEGGRLPKESASEQGLGLGHIARGAIAALTGKGGTTEEEMKRRAYSRKVDAAERQVAGYKRGGRRK